MKEKNKTEKKKSESATRCTALQTPPTQLTISTCYFTLHRRSHSATQWNELQNLINCTNRAMRMFSATCKQKKGVSWGRQSSKHMKSRQHAQHVAKRLNSVISTYNTSQNVST